MKVMEEKSVIPQIKPELSGDRREDRVEERPLVSKINIEGNNNEGSSNKVQLSRFKEGLVRGRNNTNPNKRKIFYITLSILGVFVFYNIVSFFVLYSNSKALMNDMIGLKASFAAQDFGLVGNSLKETQKDLSKLNTSYKLIFWVRLVPFLGRYVSDGQHVINAGKYGIEVSEKLVAVSTPYADLLGFSGGVDVAGDKTASDRIDFLVKTLPEILPELDSIIAGLEKVDGELVHINPSRYPVRFVGKEVRSNLELVLDTYNGFSDFLKDGKPLIEKAPYLLGLDDKRRYLIIFQNDKELRPSGGFITAYSLMDVEKAKFDPTTSDDIYNLDRSYKPIITAPDPIIDYLKGPYTVSDKLFLRDMNWSPDFSVSMEMFTKEIESLDLGEIDGVIAVDTQLLVNLIDVLGPIPVAGFGNYSNEIVEECNCPQVIYELESFADVEGPVVWDPAGTGKIIYAPPNMDNRKKIIGPLMNSIMASAFGSPKEKIADLFNAIFKSVTEKHILLYMLDEESQAAAESFGIAGTMKDSKVDYLHVNDANLGGRKSNLYVTQSVHQEVNVASDGSVEKYIEITYQNPAEYDGWLNSILPNWVRIYVPKGSVLLESDGLSGMPEPYEELGYTVFAGFFELRPQGVSKVELKYQIPHKFNDYYELFVQKQSGKDTSLYTVSLGKGEEEFVLNKDTEIKIRI